MSTAGLPGSQLLYEILRRRNDPGFRKQRAELRRGADETTEYYAIPYVFPALPPNSNEHERIALLRMAALAAEFVDVPAFQRGDELKRKPFGRWCQEVSRQKMKLHSEGATSEEIPSAAAESETLDRSRNDAIAERLAYLHTQDLEEAIKTVRRILQIAVASKPVPPLDYFDLYRLLLHWGKGASAESRAMRMSPLRNYYSSFTLSTNEPGGKTAPLNDPYKGE